MWIRTQNKMQLVKINEIHIKVDEDGFVGIWVDDKKESLKYFLGTYKSKERAIEVLDEIQKKINDMNKNFLMACMSEKGVYDVIAWDDFVYQMPEV